MKKISRTFSPVLNNKGLKPNEYKDKYPELDERDETRHLSGIELMWCWYYGSKESPYKLYDHNEKCKLVTEFVFDTIRTNEYYEDGNIQLLRDGNISDQKWYSAIEFFRGVNTDLRENSKQMLIAIYDTYSELAFAGTDSFTDDKGIIDISRYTSTMNKIKEEQADLIEKIERGYGTSVLMSHGDKNNEGQYYCAKYIKSKRH